MAILTRWVLSASSLSACEASDFAPRRRRPVVQHAGSHVFGHDVVRAQSSGRCLRTSHVATVVPTFRDQVFESTHDPLALESPATAAVIVRITRKNRIVADVGPGH